MIKHHKQVSLTDCGHACVKTILSNYGYDINTDNYFNSKSTQGLSLLDIEKILKKYKVKSESYKLDELNKLREIRFPCIAVVKRNSLFHYVVILNISEEFIDVSDPAEAMFTQIKFSEFEEEFTGIVLVPEASSDSERIMLSEAKKKLKSEILYLNFISNFSFCKKLQLVLLCIAKIGLPIFMTIILQYIMVNSIGLELSKQIFIVVGVLFTLLVFKMIASKEVKLKTSIENDFLSLTLKSYYKEELNILQEDQNYDYTIGYFWNLLNSVSGVFYKFYLKIYVFILCLTVIALMYFNFAFSIITLMALLMFFMYNHRQLNNIENIQRDMVANSSNFSYFVESSIDSVYDILAFNKKEKFFEEFDLKLGKLLKVKLVSAELNEQIEESLQVFSVVLISVLLFSIHFVYFRSKIIDYFYSVLIVILLANILQTLLKIWIVYKRSLYSLNFINLRSHIDKLGTKENVNLKCSEIKSLKIVNLSKKYDDTLILKGVNFELNEGNIYVIKGDNGTGKTTLLKIIQGFVSPTGGYIQVNDKKYTTLKGTNIVEYIGIYSNEFHLFSASIIDNIKFDLFSNSKNSEITKNSFVGLSNMYQVSSYGRNLSKGQQQKILIKRAVYEDKWIYLFDEPTSNLDTTAKSDFIEMIETIKNKGKIVCIVTHDSDLLNLASGILDLNLLR